MFKNHLITATRNLMRQKVFTLVNTLGLAIGMMCFLGTSISIRSQFNYDAFHEKKERIYRFIKIQKTNNKTYYQSRTGAPLAPLLKTDFPEIEHAVRFTRWSSTVQYGELRLEEPWGFVFTDPEVFEIFTFPLISGNAETALQNPFSVVVTETTAKKYFGDKNPVGETITYTNELDKTEYDFTITGVLKDIPGYSQIKFHFLASLNTVHSFSALSKKFFTQQWSGRTWTYALLHKGSNPDAVAARLPDFAKRHVKSNAKSHITFDMEPLLDVYLHSRARMMIGDGGRWLIYTQSALALFILLIACLNFMNLATARATTRAREVGVRKVMGSNRSQLMQQFLTESLLLSFAGMILCFVLFEILFGAKIDALSDPQILLMAFGTVGLTTLLSGLYPALFLSAFQPAQVLSGHTKLGTTGGFRTVTVVFQFIVSIVMIVVTIVGYQYVDRMLNEKLGFEPKHVISLPIDQQSVKKYQQLKTELLKDARILGVTAASTQPGIGSPNFMYTHSEQLNKDIGLPVIFVDRDFAQTMQIDMIESTSTSTDQSDRLTFLLNRKVLDKLGWSTATGNSLELFYWTGTKKQTAFTGEVSGVTENFFYQGVRSNSITHPLLMIIHPNRYRYILIRTHPDHTQDVLHTIEALWTKIMPDQVYEYAYLDERIHKENLIMQDKILQFSVVTVLPIFIACLGLFGLTAFTIDRRIKEIGIRKVMGASVFDIATLLSRQFVRWVILAAFIACPITYFGLDLLFRQIPYQPPQSPLAYVLGFAITLLLALLTVNLLVVRAARANPVDALRTE